MRRPLTCLAALVVGIGVGASARAEKAPPVEPSTWLNSKTPVTWEGLKGRLILVEKWATW
jgi:hypothetical protein